MFLRDHYLLFKISAILHCNSQREISLNQHTLPVIMKKFTNLLGREPVIKLAFKKLTIAVTKKNL